MNDSFYSLQEVCDILRISRPTLWKMEKRGEIQTFRIGQRKKFVTAKEIDRYLKNAVNN